MVANMLAGFEEFQNTKASKKALEKEGELSLTTRIAKGWKGKLEINIIFSKHLILDMQKNKLTRFKLLYNEKENAIGMRYDNSSNCYDLDNYSIQENGTVQIHDKFVTYTLLPLIQKEGIKGFKFTGRHFQLGSCYIFRVNKRLK